MRKLHLLLLFSLLFSCNKEEPSIKESFSYLDQNLKQNYSFEENSFWLYQNQDLTLDSVTLVKKELGFTGNCPKSNCDRREFIKMNFQNTAEQKSFNHYLLSNHIKFNGGGLWGEEGQPIYQLNQKEGEEFNGLVVGKTLDSLVILNNKYFNVQIMHIKAEMQYQKEFEFDQDLYFSPKVGIIRKVIYDTVKGNQIWDLKSYYLAPKLD